MNFVRTNNLSFKVQGVIQPVDYTINVGIRKFDIWPRLNSVDRRASYYNLEINKFWFILIYT